MQPLTDAAALDAALAAPRAVLFKHSPRCSLSAWARRELAGAGVDWPVYEIDVVAGRALSDAVAARLGVRHESPQLLVLEAGRVRWHGSHGVLGRETIRRRLAEAAPGTRGSGGSVS